MADTTPEMRGALEQMAEARIAAPDGRISARLSLGTRMFFADGGKTEGRRRALGALRALTDDLEGFRAMQVPDGGLVPYDPAVLAGLEPAPPPETDDLDLALWAEDRPGRAAGNLAFPSATLLAGADFFEGVTWYSTLALDIDLAALESPGPEAILARTLRAADILKPDHGVVGMTLRFNPVTYSDADGVAAFPALKRFPGLHDGRTSGFVAAVAQPGVRPGLMAVNWLTVVGNPLLDRLGEGALDTLPPDCTVHPYNGGVAIRAGVLPQMGDGPRGLETTAYQAVARALDPILFTAYQSPLLVVPPPLDAMAESLAWVRRFD